LRSPAPVEHTGNTEPLWTGGCTAGCRIPAVLHGAKRACRQLDRMPKCPVLKI